MLFIEIRLQENKLQANNICFLDKKKKGYQERESDNEVQFSMKLMSLKSGTLNFCKVRRLFGVPRV